MMYASTKDFFKSHLDGLSLEFQASELDDISEQVGGCWSLACCVFCVWGGREDRGRLLTPEDTREHHALTQTACQAAPRSWRLPSAARLLQEVGDAVRAMKRG
jgi:hypothetical protein